ncbi:unnamed protein product [Rotaria magnacalcarata]
MSNTEPFGSSFPPPMPPPPPPMNHWWCNNCHQVNSRARYQCTLCRGNDTYDLCEHCIGQSSTVHPGHPFALMPAFNIIHY